MTRHRLETAGTYVVKLTCTCFNDCVISDTGVHASDRHLYQAVSDFYCCHFY